MRTRPNHQRRLERALLKLALVSALMPLSGCLTWLKPRPDFTWDGRPAGVTLATTPPGAEVVIDGVNSGFATPCMIDLDEDETYRIEFELEGYRTAGLFLTPNRRWFLIPYTDATRAPRVWRVPLWYPLGAGLLPFRTNTALAPSRVHLRLRLGSESGDAPPSAAAEGLPGI